MEQPAIIEHSDASSARTIPCDEEKTTGKKDQVEVSEKDDSVRKDLAQAAQESVEQPQYGEHPDGGFRAWLVVTGVSASAIACARHDVHPLTGCRDARSALQGRVRRLGS